MVLTPKQRQFLKGLAHPLAPVVRVGKGAVSEAVIKETKNSLEAHELILKLAHEIAKRAADAGDDGTNDLVVSDVIRSNELQVWFVSEHLVDTPLVRAR